MSLASLTVDLTLGLARFEADSGKAAQIVSRDAEKMARATEKADAAIRRYTASFGRVGVEAKVVSAAVAGASDSALRLFANVEAGGTAFSRVGSQGSAAFKAIGAAADSALQGAEARILAIADKARQVRDQAAQLTAAAVAQNAAGTLSDDGLKKRLADIRAVQAAELERIANTARADADARRAAQAERIASSQALATAQVGSGGAAAEVQTRIFLAFATAQAAAADAEAAAQARVAQAQAAATAASERGQAAQRTAYETKVAYIAKVNEEAAALFRTADAQRQLDAERAGVSSRQAAQLAKFAGDREFLAGVRQQIDAQQRLADEFGKTTAEILQQQAAQRGLTNTAAGAIARLDELEQSNKLAAKSANDRKTADAFLAGLNERAAGINTDGTQKSQSELLALRAAALGVGKEAEAAIAKIAALDGKTGQLGRSAFASRNQLLTLQYTIGDVIASAGSGTSLLTILLQQGGQIFDAFGGVSAQGKGGFFRNFISTLGAVITPARLAILGVVGAVGTLGVAMFRGAEQSKQYADAIVLSGNFAGQTEGKFNSLTRTIAEGGQVTAAAAREFGQALIATGEVGPAVFDKAAAAATLYGQATGKTAKEVAQSFAGMSQDVVKWATEHNRSMNFVTAAQLEQIRAFQEAGKSAEAQGLVYDLLNKRLQDLEPNLGTLDRAIRLVSNSWNKFWDAAYAVGRTETIDDKIAALRSKILRGRAPETAETDGGAALVAAGSGRRGATLDAQSAKDAVQLDNLLRDKQQQTNAAFLLATAAATNKAAIAGRPFVESLLDGADASRKYARELQQLEQALEKNRNAGTPFTEAQEKLARAELKKKFEPKGSRGADKDAKNERKAELDKDLQVFAAALAREKDALRFQQDELRAIYDAGNLSLAEFYDDREATIKRGTLAELNEQANAIGRIGEELKRGDLKKDERIKLERQLAEAQTKASDIQRDADNAAKLANYERAAAVKSLTREVDVLQASLKDLQGDPLGAAQQRAAQLLESVRNLAARSAEAGGQSPVDVDGYAKAIELANQFAEVQRRVGLATADASRAEAAYFLRANTGAVGLIEQDQAIYKMRAVALVQLGELTEAATRLAEASTDPNVKAFAADLALQYAQAAQSVDPAMVRLKANAEDLGASLANVFSDAINNGRSFMGLVDNIGRTVQASITNTLITQPLEQFLKSGLSSIVQGSGPIGSFLQSAVGVSAGPAAAAQATTLSLSQLTVAASQASIALQSISGASAAGTATASGGGLFGWIPGLFGGGGGLIPGGVGAVPYHIGGLVGQGGAARAVSSAAFAGAKRYHGGGLVANEVPAILMGGPRGMREEVLHARDPRHRDNMGAALLQMLAAGGATRGSAAGYTKPAVRYHSGGVVGMQTDAAASLARGTAGGRDAGSQQRSRRGGDTYNIHVPPGTSRDTADQIASRVAMKLASASRRNN